MSNLTKQREAVLAVVQESAAHLTASEIYALAGKKLPGISFATVYNSLRYLTANSMIAEIKFGDGASRFDRRTDRHDHAICTSCGTMADFELKEVADIVQSAARRSKFKAESLHLTLYGL
jgi:Fur family transcriptional regulator, peroxide stress response regulator